MFEITLIYATCRRPQIEQNGCHFQKLFAEIYINFGPALLANQITSNAGFISISLFGPGPKSDIDIGTVIKQAVVLLNVAGAFL